MCAESHSSRKRLNSHYFQRSPHKIDPLQKDATVSNHPYYISKPSDLVNGSNSDEANDTSSNSLNFNVLKLLASRYSSFGFSLDINESLDNKDSITLTKAQVTNKVKPLSEDHDVIIYFPPISQSLAAQCESSPSLSKLGLIDNGLMSARISNSEIPLDVLHILKTFSPPMIKGVRRVSPSSFHKAVDVVYSIRLAELKSWLTESTCSTKELKSSLITLYTSPFDRLRLKQIKSFANLISDNLDSPHFDSLSANGHVINSIRYLSTNSLYPNSQIIIYLLKIVFFFPQWLDSLYDENDDMESVLNMMKECVPSFLPKYCDNSMRNFNCLNKQSLWKYSLSLLNHILDLHGVIPYSHIFETVNRENYYNIPSHSKVELTISDSSKTRKSKRPSVSTSSLSSTSPKAIGNDSFPFSFLTYDNTFNENGYYYIKVGKYPFDPVKEDKDLQAKIILDQLTDSESDEGSKSKKRKIDEKVKTIRLLDPSSILSEDLYEYFLPHCRYFKVAEKITFKKFSFCDLLKQAWLHWRHSSLSTLSAVNSERARKSLFFLIHLFKAKVSSCSFGNSNALFGLSGRKNSTNEFISILSNMISFSIADEQFRKYTGFRRKIKKEGIFASHKYSEYKNSSSNNPTWIKSCSNDFNIDKMVKYGKDFLLPPYRFTPLWYAAYGDLDNDSLNLNLDLKNLIDNHYEEVSSKNQNEYIPFGNDLIVISMEFSSIYYSYLKCFGMKQDAIDWVTELSTLLVNGPEDYFPFLNSIPESSLREQLIDYLITKCHPKISRKHALWQNIAYLESYIPSNIMLVYNRLSLLPNLSMDASFFVHLITYTISNLIIPDVLNDTIIILNDIKEIMPWKEVLAPLSSKESTPIKEKGLGDLCTAILVHLADHLHTSLSEKFPEDKLVQDELVYLKTCTMF